MSRKSILQRTSIIIVILSLLFGLFPFINQGSNSYAAGYKKYSMHTYDKVLKEGNTVYCAGARGIYKVRLKKGRVASKKLLTKAGAPLFGAYTYVGEMRRRGNYIYYMHGSEGTMWAINRVNIKTKKMKNLAYVGETRYYGYVIRKGKIYYDDGSYPRAKVYSMNLNGTSVKRAKVIPNMIQHNSNAKGYTVVIKEKGGYARDYLKTPKGTFYLGRAKIGV